MANDSDRAICEVVVAPVSGPQTEEDLLTLADTPTRVEPRDQFVAAADYAALDGGTTYSLRLVPCSGDPTEAVGEFSFGRVRR